MENQIQNQTEFKWVKFEEMTVGDRFLWVNLREYTRSLYKGGQTP